MKLWLEKAGIFIDGWRVDESKFQSILGMPSTDIDILAQLSREQKAYLRALANIGGTGPFQSNDIERLATSIYGIKFNEKNLAKQVLYPLRDYGYITLKRSTKEEGRGSRWSWVAPTSKLEADLISPLLEQFEQQIGAEFRPLLRKTLAEILSEVDSDDQHIRGLALEALIFKLMRLIDLRYVATRLRGSSTGGAEVDLIFEGSRLVFSRWQVQCKNVDRGVVLDDVAKEVGLTHMLKSNVIVMVSTGTIGSEARRYANKIMQDSNLCIVMIDRSDIQAIARNPVAIVDILNREARHAMTLKTLDL
jgi:site-specific DNA-methyltransferase (cytosine-N4-specific)